jgi:tetratricopeptide (TPR) repeat protein
MKRRRLTILLLSLLLFGAILSYFLKGSHGTGVSIEDARSYIKLGNYPEAFRLYRQFITNNPSDLDARIEFARLLMQQGEAEEGLNLLNAALDRFRGDPRLTGLAPELSRSCDQLALRMTDSGVAAMGRNEPSRSLQFYRSAIFFAGEESRWQTDTTNSATLVARARLRDARVNFAYAASLCNDPSGADSISGTDPATLIMLATRLSTSGRAAYDKNDFSTAVHVYTYVVRYLVNGNAGAGAYAGFLSESYYSLGMSQLMAGHPQDALPNFRNALSVAPKGFYLLRDITSTITRLEHQ